MAWVNIENGDGSLSVRNKINELGQNAVFASAVKLTGEMDQNGNTIGGAETDNGNSGTSKTIDWTKGNHQVITLTGDCTLTFTAPTKACMLSLRIIQDGTGGRVLTLPTMKKPGGEDFVFSTDIGAIDILSLYYDGTSYYGQLGANFL